MPKTNDAETKNGGVVHRRKRTAPKKETLAKQSVGAAKVSKKKKKKPVRGLPGKAERKIVAKPKAKPKAKAAAARKRTNVKAKKLSASPLLSKSAARAMSSNSKEKQAQKMSQYRRRLTMENRILDFWNKVGGSALLVDITSGGAARPGRTHIVGSGRFGPKFNELTLHEVLKPIIDKNADWRKATKKMTMQDFFRKVSLEDYGIVVPARAAAADADMDESSGAVSE